MTAAPSFDAFAFSEPSFPILKQERFDEDNMKELLKDTDFAKADRKRLSEYNKHRISGGRSNVSYKFGAGCEELQLGRLFPDNGIGLQSFRFDFRNPLTAKYYWDVDIENAHYRIAAKKCQELGIRCENLERYVSQRKECLQMVSSSRKKAKTEFLKTLYLGNVKLYHDSYQEQDGEITPEGRQFIAGLSKEVDNLATILWDRNKALHDLKLSNEKTPLKKKRNPKASLMSLLFQTEERKMILALDQFLEFRGRRMGVLIHDGGLVEKLEGENSFPEQLLREGERAIEKVTGYDVVLAVKPIEYEWRPKPQAPLPELCRFAKNDNEASEILFEELKERFKANQGRLFYKEGHIWTHDKERIDHIVFNYILNSGIYRGVDKNDNLIPYSQNVTDARKLREALYSKVLVNNNDEDLYDKFHRTTLDRLCFRDGVLDYKARTFCEWDYVDFEYYSTVMIDRDFAEYFENPNLELVKELKQAIFVPVFGENTETVLHFLARGMAGEREDKNWASLHGNRDCGKGVIYDALKAAHGAYVRSYEIANIMYNRKTAGMDVQNASKQLYWLIDLEFVRLAISQETPDVSMDMKVNGKLQKKITGGNDTMIGKRNYDRVDTHFNIETTFFNMGNSAVVVDSDDCSEHRLDLQSVTQFKSKEEIDALRAERESAIRQLRNEGASADIIASREAAIEREFERYRIRDPSIKEKCKTEEWSNAIVYLIFQSFKDYPISLVKKSAGDESEGDFIGKVHELYHITKNESDILTCEEVHCALAKYDKKKVAKELDALGAAKKKSPNREFRNKWCYVGIKQVEESK